jgi:hypothetical protein
VENKSLKIYIRIRKKFLTCIQYKFRLNVIAQLFLPIIPYIKIEILHIILEYSITKNFMLIVESSENLTLTFSTSLHFKITYFFGFVLSIVKICDELFDININKV